MICYCGHDCSRCKTYIATINDDDIMRQEVIEFYKTTFQMDLKLNEINCLGGHSDTVMTACRECPWKSCAISKGIAHCTECDVYPCSPLAEYIEKYVNRYNQIY